MKLRKILITTSALAIVAAATGVSAETVRIAEHRQARIDALLAVVPLIEEVTGVDVEVVEYPGPDREYVAKLLTELRAGAGPDVFPIPDALVVDFVSAGYLVDVTEEMKNWDDYDQLFPVVQELITEADGSIHIMPTMISAQQLYYRRDIFEKFGLSTEQPATWDELIDRAIAAKEATGAYGLMLPMGLTWGGGAFTEGFLHLLVGSSTPTLSTEDGKLNLSSEGIGEVMQFYEDLVANDTLPVDPLLGPEPWVIPKYEMFPAGELLATTCGSWCYIFDWGPESPNPIPDVTKAVGTWAVPGKDGGLNVLVHLSHPWAVNSSAVDVDASTKVLMAMGSLDLMVSYARNEGNVPVHMGAADDPGFQELEPLVPVLNNLGNGTFVPTMSGFSTVSEGVARATEALLLGETDAAGAQTILIDYVTNVLGADAVQ